MKYKPIDTKIVAFLNADHYPALKEVIAAYWDPLLAIGQKRIQNKMDVEELAADTFCKLWQLKEKKFRDEFSLFFWLRKTMTNACVDYWRKKQNNPSITSLEVIGEKDFEEQDYLEVEEYEKISEKLFNILNDGIEELPKKRKNLVLLLKEGLSDKEIAARLGIAKSTFRNQRGSAFDSLKRYFSMRQTNQSVR